MRSVVARSKTAAASWVRVEAGRCLGLVAMLALAMACQTGPPPTPLDQADTAFAERRHREAGVLYQDAARNQPDRRAEALHGMARVHLVSRRPEASLKIFGELARTDRVYFQSHARRDYADALLHAGRSRLADEHVEPAINALEALYKIDPDHPKLSKTLAQAYVAHGAALSMHGRRTEAMQRFEQAMAVRPEAPEAWVGAAEILIATGRKQEALELLTDARRHNPSDRRVRALTVQAMGVY